MRAVIDDAVEQAVAPLKDRVEELESRLRAVEESGGPSPAEPPKRPSAGRTARGRGPSEGKAGEAATAGR